MLQLIKTGSIISIIIFILIIIMSYTLKQKTERQNYRLVKTIQEIEIRFYPKAIMATVNSPSETDTGNSNNNFSKLAGYIFGGNQASNKISMTAPVHMERNNEISNMSFVMPSNYKMEQLPKPNDESIKLHYSEEGYFAAIKFGGYANEKTIVKKENELKIKLKELGILHNNKFVLLGYNAPWDVINRENEVLVKVEYTE
jgi:hypothetical protein